jgi:hypothetical protein
VYFFVCFNYFKSLNSHVFVYNLAFKFLAISFVPDACADVFPRCWQRSLLLRFPAQIETREAFCQYRCICFFLNIFFTVMLFEYQSFLCYNCFEVFGCEMSMNVVYMDKRVAVLPYYKDVYVTTPLRIKD